MQDDLAIRMPGSYLYENDPEVGWRKRRGEKDSPVKGKEGEQINAMALYTLWYVL